MPVHDDDVTLTLPRSTMLDVVALSSDLNNRMHFLLERNTDGALTPIEILELESLVRMAQVGQIISMAVAAGTRP